MTTEPDQPNLPARIADALVSVPKALIPSSVKALDRLVGAAVDIPVAWLAQKKAQIDAQTQAYTIVEGAIAKIAADDAAADQEVIRNAVSVLVRKSYQKQKNREAVAAATVNELNNSQSAENAESENEPRKEIDEDWFNYFERYAEDATTERMQILWGRVLAGELTKPGKYSVRTLRSLSELSQAEGILFAEFCSRSFGGTATQNGTQISNPINLQELIHLESAGLIQGAAGTLNQTFRFNADGKHYVKEGNLVIMFSGQPDHAIQQTVYLITPLGQELISLLPGRDKKIAATTFALSVRDSTMTSAYIMNLDRPANQPPPMEIIWQAPSTKQ